MSRLERIWLLKQNEGQFMLLQGIHCIGLDFDEGYIFDSSRPNVLRISKARLKLCGFNTTAFKKHTIMVVSGSVVAKWLTLSWTSRTIVRFPKIPFFKWPFWLSGFLASGFW